MRRCSGSPCSTYLVLRSHNVSPAASLAISSSRCRDPGFRVPVPVTSGHTGARTGGKFEVFKKFHFFKMIILSLLLCPVPCLHFDFSF
ncbi:unnamed protein product, partial [Staurois parvus]